MKTTPIGPPRLRNILIAFVLSLCAGIGLAFLLDFLDDTVKSIEDVDRYIHLPALALIPVSRPDRARLIGLPGGPPVSPSESTALAMIDDARSPIAEAYRHLRTSLLLSSAGQPPKTILVTSSQPSEGKTTTAINTAFMLAQTGADVLSHNRGTSLPSRPTRTSAKLTQPDEVRYRVSAAVPAEPSEPSPDSSE